MNTDSSTSAVDELLASGADEQPMRAAETTGVYDLSFFESVPLPPPARPAHDLLEDARVGLGLFIDESREALKSRELNIEQRVHIATIVSYIEALAERFDRVRRPDFGKR
jgi:hypothetical protein